MSEESLLPILFDYFLGGLIALVCASFAGHFGFRSADRLPGESRKPHCFYCLRPLQFHEYFPLFGWLLRFDMTTFSCPCGKRKGQWPQPMIEILGFILGVAAVYIAGWSPLIVPVCMALGLLVAMAFIDLAFGIIPDGLNLLLAFLGLTALLMGDGHLYMTLIGAAGLLGLGLLLAIGYSKLRHKEMLGLGDVKFFAAAGLWLPIELIPWFLIASGILGAVMGVTWQRLAKTEEFPFAPALCVALIGAIYYQLYLYAMP